MKLQTSHKNTTNPSKKREWGSEKRTTPLPYFHTRPSTTKIALGRLAIITTIVFWFMYFLSIIIRQFIDGPQNYDFTMEAFSYLFVMSFLTFSALMYLIARQGAFERFVKHTRVPRSLLDEHFAKHQESITVLIPSYSEEPQVIRKTILSAALQEFPKLKVVLLLDDDPNPVHPDKKQKLENTRKLKHDIDVLLAEPANRFKKALASFKKERKESTSIQSDAIQKLADEYAWASLWLKDMMSHETIEDHVDVFFTEQVLRELANEFDLVKQALEQAITEQEILTADRIQQLYNRLVWTFNAEIEIFERKKYASLSHEANKAMNLNAYIGLMGGQYRKEETVDGTVLIPTSGTDAHLTIPDSKFLLTLDADSVLLREYCLRLVYFLNQPDNANVAVTQTPYSSFRGAYTRIERLAGATTDIQHILHQGMSKFGATFWVGANAVIRKKALEDIVQREWVKGFEVKRYIQDRTVIEDTESSIDLALHNWKLINYPERLSYSATPPDFGSLIVQRRRWANGGLLILPKLLTQIRLRRARGEVISITEMMLRVNYMASIAWSTFGLAFLLAYPYDGRLLSPLVILAALPYFLTMASDLKYCGYNYSDIFRIYGFNLILLPVNLAGVLKSLQQGLTGKKIPFARTPKVKDRTAATLPYVLSPLFIIGFSIFTFLRNVDAENWGNAAFAGFNTVTAIWAVVAYIGIGNLFVDLWIGLTSWLYVDVKKKQKMTEIEKKPILDWKAVLYHGQVEGKVPYTTPANFAVK